MMRWWWFGPSVNQPELDRELTVMANAGLGGVEVAYVYPLATATTEFGSDAFLAISALLPSGRSSSGSASTSRSAAAGPSAGRISRPRWPPGN
jgi:hypothetical protein